MRKQRRKTAKRRSAKSKQDVQRDPLEQIDATDIGDPDALLSKRSGLLDSTIGITDLNWGRDSAMAALLEPYAVLQSRLQTVKQPVPHMAHRWYLEFYASMELFVGNAVVGTELQVQLKAAVEAKEFRLAAKIQDKIDARKDPTFPSPYQESGANL